jgi:hypothetical protein
MVKECGLRRCIWDHHDRDLRVRDLALVTNPGAEGIGRDVHDRPLVLVIRDRSVSVGATRRRRPEAPLLSVPPFALSLILGIPLSASHD